MAAGPLLGGALVALANWRAVFAVNVVIGIPAVIWSLLSMPSVVRRGRRLDLAGMGTATVLIGGLVFALIEAPAQGWLHPAVLTAIALTVAAVEPALHGAASAAFNTSRQIGGAIGVATFGPLLGTAHNLSTGFITCVIVASASSAIALLVTTLGLRHATFRGRERVYSS